MDATALTTTLANSMSVADKDKLHSLLDELILKHTDNDYVTGRLNNFISNLLPSALENAHTINKLREDRKRQLTTHRDDFVRRFLSKNLYFYSHATELFIKYDDFHFRLYREDDILHQVLSTITQEQALMPWKHKIKNNIIKAIKDRSPLTAIPESVTIQFVLNQLCPTYFPSRNAAKYFLTVIGDCMIRVTTAAKENVEKTAVDKGTEISVTATAPPTIIDSSIIYLLSPLVKELVRELANQCYTYFGPSTILHNIKFKHHAHQYASCRLIPTAATNANKPVPLPGSLLKHTLDILCVAVHYSARFGSGDLFLQQCNDPALMDYALLLHRLTPALLVDTFINQSLTLACPGAKINEKNMLFLWKKFLQERQLPNVLFSDAFKTLLKERLTYDVSMDAFINVSSVHIPLVANFLKFWETTMVEDDLLAEELEIDEISALFKQSGYHVTSRNAPSLIDLISYYFPDIVVEDDKYIMQVRCNLWPKRHEVITAIEQYKLERFNNIDINVTNISLYDAYANYLSTKQKPALSASKRYFERVVKEIYTVDEDGIIIF